MPRTILGDFGPDTPKSQAPRITKNGPVDERDVLDYAPPQGPKYLGGGLGLRGGTNFGNAGSQGKSSIQAEGSGTPGQLNTHVLMDGLDNDDQNLVEGD